MIVVTITDCPPKLRGDLSKWLMEINTGVYVGKVSARVRDELWQRICEHCTHGRATMVFSTNNEQGMSFRVNNTSWQPVDYEGITLIKHPAQLGEQKTEGRKGKAEIQQIIQAKEAAKQTIQKKLGYVVIDVETTGLKSEADEIIELAAVRVIDHKITEEFSTLVRPEQEIPVFIQNLTGITEESIRNQGQSLEEGMRKFIEFLGESPIVSHNIGFDKAFLNAACAKLNISRINNTARDTLNLARRKVDDVADYKLATLAQYFQIAVDEQHRAMADCKITFQLYEKLNEF